MVKNAKFYWHSATSSTKSVGEGRAGGQEDRWAGPGRKEGGNKRGPEAEIARS